MAKPKSATHSETRTATTGTELAEAAATTTAATQTTTTSTAATRTELAEAAATTTTATQTKTTSTAAAVSCSAAGLSAAAVQPVSRPAVRLPSASLPAGQLPAGRISSATRSAAVRPRAAKRAGSRQCERIARLPRKLKSVPTIQYKCGSSEAVREIPYRSFLTRVQRIHTPCPRKKLRVGGLLYSHYQRRRTSIVHEQPVFLLQRGHAPSHVRKCLLSLLDFVHQ